MFCGSRGADFKKTIFYLKRNGIRNTFYAIREGLAARRQPLYRYILPDETELDRQRRRCKDIDPAYRVSIVVPCYRTDRAFLLEMIDSVRGQTYPEWELILADATEDDSVERAVEEVKDGRIRYFRLGRNDGIAENTNRGIEAASGDYVGLLDHDDLLTPDALFYMVKAVSDSVRSGVRPGLVYSDEDKCSGDGTRFYDPNRKEDFNLDLLLSNNYICHFMMMERELIQGLKMRREYDGSQDYDLILRVAGKLEGIDGAIVHVPRVLYHWRCHSSSTAENPQSKLYAYDAGRRAIQDFAEKRNWRAEAEDTVHLGFYRLKYPEDTFRVRPDVGAIGGPLFCRGRILSGRLSEAGKVYYGGLNCHYSGPLHRAALQQDAEAVDLRNIRLRQELWELFEEVTGVPYRTQKGTCLFDAGTLPRGTDIASVSVALGKAVRKAGYRILYLPERGVHWKK